MLSQILRASRGPRRIHGFCDNRPLHTKTRLFTDGVFRDLTNMRVQVPWIEALRQQRDAAATPRSAQSKQGAQISVAPKRMSESYHKVVRYIELKAAMTEHLTLLIPAQILPLAKDPWLLDNYLNVNGHIRFVFFGYLRVFDE